MDKTNVSDAFTVRNNRIRVEYIWVNEGHSTVVPGKLVVRV